MSHRLALVLSIVLTLILAAGVLAGRDRLFAVDANAGAATTPPAVTSASSLPGVSTDDSAAPRVIEIPLPASAPRHESLARGDDDDHERVQYSHDDEGEDDD
jgi:hypothetical protein